MRFLAVLLLLLLLVIPISACHPAVGFSYGGSFSYVTPGVAPALVGAYYQPPVASVGFLTAPAPLLYAAPAFAAPPPVAYSAGFTASYGEVGAFSAYPAAVEIRRGFFGRVRVRVFP